MEALQAAAQVHDAILLLENGGHERVCEKERAMKLDVMREKD